MTSSSPTQLRRATIGGPVAPSVPTATSPVLGPVRGRPMHIPQSRSGSGSGSSVHVHAMGRRLSGSGSGSSLSRFRDPEFSFEQSPRSALRRKLEADKINKLTQIDVRTLNAMFDGLQGDADESPTLNKAKFVELMVTSGLRVFRDQSIAISFFEALDLNGNGSVDKKELMLGLVTLASGSLEDKLRTCFKVFDLNKDNLIQREELACVLRALSTGSLGKPVSKIVDDIFEQFDTDRNGGIDIDEFIHAAKERPDLQHLFVLDVPIFQPSPPVGPAAAPSVTLPRIS